MPPVILHEPVGPQGFRLATFILMEKPAMWHPLFVAELKRIAFKLLEHLSGRLVLVAVHAGEIAYLIKGERSQESKDRETDDEFVDGLVAEAFARRREPGSKIQVANFVRDGQEAQFENLDTVEGALADTIHTALACHLGELH